MILTDRHRVTGLPLLGALAMTVALAVAACASAAESSDSDAGLAPLVASGVGVVASGCAGPTNEIGSGVIIDRPGQVITTAHTVAGALDVIVVDASGSEFPATVVALDKDADLAVLEVPGLDAPPLEVGNSASSSPPGGAATVMVWSRELGVHTIAVDVTRRLDITIEDIYVEDVVQRAGIELHGEISVGDSGGAIVDADRRVIGIVYARSRQRPQTAFATDFSELERLLDERPTDAYDRCT